MKYRIMTIPLTREETWSLDFVVPEGWLLESVLGSPISSSRTSGWDHVTVLLRKDDSHEQ